MSLPHLALFIQPRLLHCSSCVHLWPLRAAMEQSDGCLAIAVSFCYRDTPLKCLPRPFANPSGSPRLHPLGAVAIAAVEREATDIRMCPESDCDPNSHYDDVRGEVGEQTCHQLEDAMTYSIEELKEIQRRRRIGLANKGKVPWNKGKKHSPETCARIKERTLEALRDPKVRKKMSEAPRLHSEQSKEKISSSLKQLWAERLKWKRLRENFHCLWAESIAEAARRGGISEDELSWGSYEKIKGEIAARQLQWAAGKAKKRENKKIRTEKRAQKRAKMMARSVQKKLKHKHKVVPRAKQKAIKSRKTRETKEEVPLSRESNLEVSLSKAHGKKLMDGQSSTKAGVMTYLQSALESFDIESIKKEQRRNTVSLADQIQAAKSKRLQIIAGGPQ